MLMSYLRNQSFDKLISCTSGVICRIEDDFVHTQVSTGPCGMLHKQEFQDKSLIGVGQRINYIKWKRPNGSTYYRITADMTPSDSKADKMQLLELLDTLSPFDL